MADGPKYIGPTAPREDQLDAVVALSNSIFRSDGEGDMGREYASLFRRDRLEQLRVFTLDDKPVSLVGVIVNDAVLLGCSTRIACIGSVCTAPSARNAGLAGRLMDDAIARARAGGASFMMISGGLNLYRRRGASEAGRLWRYTLPNTLLKMLASGGRTSAGLEMARATDADVPDILRLYEGEAIRFHRDERAFVTSLNCGRLCNAPGVTYVLRRGRGGPAAAVIAVNTPHQSPRKQPNLALREMAGDRLAALAGVAQAADEHHAATVEIDAYPSDHTLAGAMAQLGVAPKTITSPCTTKVLDVDRLWRDFSPLIAGRIGDEALAAISIASQADELAIHTLTFEMGRERWEVHGPRAIVSLFFGTPDGDEIASASASIKQVLRRALPLPHIFYGHNYA